MSIFFEEMEELKYINKEKLISCFARLNKSMSQIAKEADLSRTTLYNIFSEKVRPNYSTLHILVKNLELTAEEFIEIFFPDIVFKKKTRCKDCKRYLKK